MPSNQDASAVEARDADLIRAEDAIAETRRQVALSMSELQREIARTIDWRQWVRRRPGLAMGIAFGVGLLLGRRR